MVLLVKCLYFEIVSMCIIYTFQFEGFVQNYCYLFYKKGGNNSLTPSPAIIFLS